jgi:hypothetical protein
MKGQQCCNASLDHFVAMRTNKFWGDSAQGALSVQTNWRANHCACEWCTHFAVEEGSTCERKEDVHVRHNCLRVAYQFTPHGQHPNGTSHVTRAASHVTRAASETTAYLARSASKAFSYLTQSAPKDISRLTRSAFNIKSHLKVCGVL